MAAFYSTHACMYDVDSLVPEKESGNIAYSELYQRNSMIDDVARALDMWHVQYTHSFIHVFRFVT